MIIYGNDERYKEEILKCKIRSVEKGDKNFLPTFPRRLEQTHQSFRMSIHSLMKDIVAYMSYSVSCASGEATIKLKGVIVILPALDMDEMNWEYGLHVVEGRLDVNKRLVMYASLVLSRQNFASYFCGLKSCGGATGPHGGRHLVMLH